MFCFYLEQFDFHNVFDKSLTIKISLEFEKQRIYFYM